MIDVGLYYQVKPGHEEEFEKAFLGVVTFLKKNFQGFIDAKLYRSVQNPQEYLIYSEWESLEIFKKFMSSRQLMEAKEYGKIILQSLPRHKILQPINE